MDQPGGVPIDRAPTPLARADTATRDEQPSDRRNKKRLRMLRRAAIIYGGGLCTMRCQIFDVSDAGAKVRPDNLPSCPDEFLLKPEIGDGRNCEVVWRSDTVLGVRFV